VGLVGHHQDRLAPFVRHFALQRPDFCRLLRIQVARRLVRQDDRRLVQQRPRNRHALLLAAGQRVRSMVRPLLQVHDRQQLVHPLPAPGQRLSVHQQRQRDVLTGRQRRQQVVLLKHDPQPATPKDRPRAVGHRRQVVPFHEQHTTRRRCQPANHVQ